MATVGNNESGKIEQFVMEELWTKGDETALLKGLLKIPAYRNKIDELSRVDATKLYEKAKSLIEDATAGRISAEDMAKTQRKIVCYLAAIDGRHLVKMLEKVADEDAYINTNEDEDAYGMER